MTTPSLHTPGPWRVGAEIRQSRNDDGGTDWTVIGVVIHDATGRVAVRPDGSKTYQCAVCYGTREDARAALAGMVGAHTSGDEDRPEEIGRVRAAWFRGRAEAQDALMQADSDACAVTGGQLEVVDAPDLRARLDALERENEGLRAENARLKNIVREFISYEMSAEFKDAENDACWCEAIRTARAALAASHAAEGGA